MRNIRNIFVTGFIALFIFLQVAIANALAPANEEQSVEQISPPSYFIQDIIQNIEEQIFINTPQFDYQFKLGPTASYWDKVAQCETRQDWSNAGRWAGGLGIYTVGEWRDKDMGTWERWGGEQFAPTPQYATKFHQIIVANRIGLFGYKELITRDPDQARRSGVPLQYLYDKSPTGFGGWGCIKSKSTGKWRIGLPQEKIFYNISLPLSPNYHCAQYEPLFEKYGLPAKLFSHIAWKQSKCNPYNPQGGLLQIPEKYHSQLNLEFGFLPSDLNDTEKNVIAAAWIVYFHEDRLSAWGYDFEYYNEKPYTQSQNKKLNDTIKHR